MYIYIYVYICIHIYIYTPPITFGVSFNINLKSQSHESLSNMTWQKRENVDGDLRMKK